MTTITTDEEAAKYSAEHFQTEHSLFTSVKVNDRISQITGNKVWRLLPGNLGASHYIASDGKYFAVGSTQDQHTDEAILEKYQQAMSAE